MNVRVFHVFIEYSLTGFEVDEANELVEGSILWLVRLYAWVGTFMKYHTSRNLGWASAEPVR